MREEKKDWFIPLILGLLSILVWFLSLKLLYPSYLTFSDAAKFADAAREMAYGRGFTTKFGFFNPRFVFTPEASQPIIPGFGILSSFALFIFFKILGATDFVVSATSGFFFIVSSLLVYLLAKKIFGQKVALFSSLAFVFTQPMLDYASIGASEVAFIFLFLLACLLMTQEKKYSLPASAVVASLLFLTRPQAIIYILGLASFVYFYSGKKRRERISCWFPSFMLSLLTLFILSKIAGQKLIHFGPLLSVFTEQATVAKNITLRGGAGFTPFAIKPLATKVFYNLYNFYKLLPNFASAYLVCLYLLSLVRWDRKDEANALQLASFFILALSFLAASATIPFMRYIHPVLPIVIIFSVEMLVWVLTKIFRQEKKVFIATLFLILFFVVGQTIGKIFLDSRYLRAHVNQDKPPVYVKLSWLLRDHTHTSDLIVTNLDTWGSWYGERKTIWFPLEPKQLISLEGQELKIDAVFLTSYKMDDENYYMGEAWREIFYHPGEIKDPFFAENFVLEKKFEIKAEETYEREGAVATLLIRRQ